MNLWPFRSGKKVAPPDTETKYSAAGPNIVYANVGLPVWTPRDYEALSRESYLYNAISYRCVKLIASSAASVDWLLTGRGGVEIEEHPLLSLLKSPAPGISGAAFLEAVVAYYLLAGNSYIEQVGPNDQRRPPTELWTLRPDRMQVIPGKFGIPQGYRYNVNGLLKDWQSDPLTGNGPILHMKDFHPVDDYYGMSRIEAAAYGIDRHNAASMHNKALLDNGARPSGALVFKPIKVGESVTAAPQKLVDAATTKLTITHTGAANAGKPFVFSGDVDWLEMGTSAKDMDFNEGKNDSARDICTALGVPHLLLVPGSSTYNNVREAKLALYEETILPILDTITSALNWWLTPRFGDALELSYDKDEIDALEPRRESKRKTVIELFDKGLITDEEARDALQYGPKPQTQIGKVDATVLTTLIDNAPDLGFEPVVKYMQSVGLYEAGMTVEKVLDQAAKYLENSGGAGAEDAVGTEDDLTVTPDADGEGDMQDEATV